MLCRIQFPGLMDVDDICGLQVAFLIQADRLTSCSITGIQRQEPLAAEGTRQQELTEVLCKYIDRFLVPALFQRGPHFRLQTRLQQSLVTVAYGFFDMR